MRFCILVSALCLLTSSFAKGQWLEDVVKVGDGPSAVAWSYPYVYVANRYSNSLSVLDQDADSVVASITVDNEPVLLAADEWQHELYCACRLGPSLHIVCSDSNAIVANLPLNGEPSAMCLSGYPARRLFVAGFNSIRCNTTVTVIDLDLRGSRPNWTCRAKSRHSGTAAITPTGCTARTRQDSACGCSACPARVLSGCTRPAPEPAR